MRILQVFKSYLFTYLNFIKIVLYRVIVNNSEVKIDKYL